jgi:hypothetical protein
MLLGLARKRQASKRMTTGNEGEIPSRRGNKEILIIYI